MKVGDLVKTYKGNYAFVVEVEPHKDPEWVNLRFLRTGNLRTGYPTEWIIKINEKWNPKHRKW